MATWNQENVRYDWLTELYMCVYMYINVVAFHYELRHLNGWNDNKSFLPWLNSIQFMINVDIRT